MLDFDIHSANDFNEQSHDNGLSRNDRVSRAFALMNAFLATIDMSLPSTRNSFNDGNGVTKSAVNALCKLIINKINLFLV